MFSAGAKQEALDRLSPSDPEKTSIFVRSFLPLIPRNEMTLIDIAKETQERVRELARSVGHEQNPAYYDGIVGRITLTGRADCHAPVTKTDVCGPRPARKRAGQAGASLTPARAPEVTRPRSKPATVPRPVRAIRKSLPIFRASNTRRWPHRPASRRAEGRRNPGAPRRIFFQLGPVLRQDAQ